MRAPLTAAALVALAALLPASAAAQVPTIYPQDISLTGQVIASSSATERTLRFTLTNHGPGSFSGKATLSLQVDPTVAHMRLASGCQMTPPATWAVTCVAYPAAEGAAQSFDVIAGFHAKRNFDRDQVIGSLTFTDLAGRPAVDADPANGRVSVDMGISAPPAGFTLDALIPGQLKHGETARFWYTVRAQLIRCIERRKAPAGFRCQSARNFGRLFKPGQPYLIHMVARKS